MTQPGLKKATCRTCARDGVVVLSNGLLANHRRLVHDGGDWCNDTSVYQNTDRPTTHQYPSNPQTFQR